MDNEMKEWFVKFDKRLDNIDQRLEQSDKRFDKLDLKFEQSDKRFDKLDLKFEQSDKRFDKLDLKFEQSDKRFDKLDLKFEQSDKRFDKLDLKFVQSDKRFDKLDLKFEQSDKRFVRIEDMMVSLIQIVGTTNARLEEMQEDLSETKNTLHTFRSETNMNFNKLNRRVTLLETDMDVAMYSIEELKMTKK